MTYRNRCKGRRKPRTRRSDTYVDWGALVRLVGGVLTFALYIGEIRAFSAYVSKAFAKAGFTPPSYDA